MCPSVMCPIEELEPWVRGELDEASAERVRAHTAGCATCQAELQWLSAEAELMARRRARQPELPARLWEGIAERVAGAARAEPVAAPLLPRRWGVGARMAYGGLLAAAAAAVVFASWPGQIHNMPGDLGGRPSVAVATPHKKLSADAALDQAELEYQHAAKVLEAEYAAERDRLPPSVAERYDRMISATRTQVADARATAGSDVDGRMVVLDGYAEYLRNLQTIVSDIR